MRAVLDTSIVVSGFLWAGTPGRLIRLAEGGQLALFVSLDLLAELRRVLLYPKFQRRFRKLGIVPDNVCFRYVKLAVEVAPATIPPTILADPSDDAVLACAVAVQADVIVSGDQHLLELKTFRGISILTVAQVLARLESASQPTGNR